MSSFQLMVTICSLILMVTKIGLVFGLSSKSCNYVVQHWIVLPLQTHYLTMVIAVYEGITRRNATTVVFQHVSVLCQYSIHRAESSFLSPALALYSTGSPPFCPLV